MSLNGPVGRYFASNSIETEKSFTTLLLQIFFIILVIIIITQPFVGLLFIHFVSPATSIAYSTVAVLHFYFFNRRKINLICFMPIYIINNIIYQYTNGHVDFIQYNLVNVLFSICVNKPNFVSFIHE